MGLCGTNEIHCCWFKGKECQHVIRIDNPPFKWACRLRLKYNSWDEVHQSEEYVPEIKQKMKVVGAGVECGHWLPTNQQCNDCKENK